MKEYLIDLERSTFQVEFKADTGLVSVATPAGNIVAKPTDWRRMCNQLLAALDKIHRDQHTLPGWEEAPPIVCLCEIHDVLGLAVPCVHCSFRRRRALDDASAIV